MNQLPRSTTLDTGTLSRIFTSTAASYNYLYILSLLDVLEKTQYQTQAIVQDEILLEMLTNAWYPHNYFKLSFGVNDRIGLYPQTGTAS